MSQAPQYNRSTGFADDERDAVGGRSTVRTDRLDAELDSVSDSINALQSNLELIQRDDGQLRDQAVTPASLSTAALALIEGNRFNPRGLWVTATVYAALDLIDHAGQAFVCPVAHTSGVFATDYATGKWQVFTGSPAASGVSFTPTGRITSTDTQAAIAELDTKTAAASSPLVSSLYGGL